MALTRLVGCRTVHEAYATFTSLWTVSAGHLSLLGGRVDYLAWYRDAADLLPLPPGARRTQLALDEAARVCMQSAALHDLLAAGFDRPNPEVKRPDRPDVRFGWIHESADAAFWTRTWGRCAEVASALPGWETLLAADTDPTALELTYSAEIAPTCATVGEAVYAELAALLRRHGATTLGYDDHQTLAADAISHVEQLVPEAQGVLRAALHNDSPALESYEIWSRERLVVRDAPRPARLHRIEDRPTVGLLSDFRGKTHVFCIARLAFRLADSSPSTPPTTSPSPASKTSRSSPSSARDRIWSTSSSSAGRPISPRSARRGRASFRCWSTSSCPAWATSPGATGGRPPSPGPG